MEGILVCKKEAVIVFQDNQSTIAMATNSKASRRSKHIEVKYHYVRDAAERQIIKIKYCPTERMLADIMTKPLPESRFVDLVSHIVHSPQRRWVGVLDYNSAGGYVHATSHGAHTRGLLCVESQPAESQPATIVRNGSRCDSRNSQHL